MVTLEELELQVAELKRNNAMFGKALRMLARSGNEVQTRRRLKIDRLVSPEGPDHIWMNTTYCFDIARRLEFMFQALHEIVHPGAVVDEAELAGNLRSDYGTIHRHVHKNPPDWEAAAREAEALLIQRHIETQEEYHFDAHMDEVIGG